jgi:hypothetical protein
VVGPRGYVAAGLVSATVSFRISSTRQ